MKKTKFAVGQTVKGPNGIPREIRKVVIPSTEWKSNHPGNWVWLYFVGQAGGFCSKYYELIESPTSCV